VQDYIELSLPDYRWPHLQDFQFTLLTTGLLGLLEKAFEYYLYDWFYQCYCKEKNDLDERDRRTRKAV
jgi:hypothetical protein